MFPTRRIFVLQSLAVALTGAATLVGLVAATGAWPAAGLLVASVLLAAALVASAALLWSLARWREALRQAVHQAQALEEGRFTAATPGEVPELAPLTRGMNAAVRRQSELVAAQSAQVAELVRRAHLDPVTGLPNRRQFIARLDTLLSDPLAPRCSVLIIRLPELALLNARHGNDAVDAWLAAAGDVLQSYPQRVPEAIVGRLNGVDLALCLPVTGVAEETAHSLLAAMRATSAAALGAVEVRVGGIDGLRGVNAGAALAAADAALARAEASAEPVVQSLADFVADPAGARAWRDQIARALAEGRVRLAEYPVLGPTGELLHFECPLEVQLDREGPYHPARRWLALAARGGLLARVDLAGIELALRACMRDALPRCVHLAGATLAAPGTASELARLFESARGATSALAIEIGAADLARHASALAGVGALLHRHQVRLGAEHAGARFADAAAVAGVALAHVKIEASLVRGLLDDPAVRDLARGLVALAHGLGAQIVAEGVDRTEALETLWSLGFDGATGPAVRVGPATA